jgi:hypothetical protein
MMKQTFSVLIFSSAGVSPGASLCGAADRSVSDMANLIQQCWRSRSGVSKSPPDQRITAMPGSGSLWRFNGRSI